VGQQDRQSDKVPARRTESFLLPVPFSGTVVPYCRSMWCYTATTTSNSPAPQRSLRNRAGPKSLATGAKRSWRRGVAAPATGHRSFSLRFMHRRAATRATGLRGRQAKWTLAFFLPPLIWRPRADEAEDHQQQQPRAHEPPAAAQGASRAGAAPAQRRSRSQQPGNQLVPKDKICLPLFRHPSAGAPALRTA
jgi:hypothetical protein